MCILPCYNTQCCNLKAVIRDQDCWGVAHFFAAASSQLTRVGHMFIRVVCCTWFACGKGLWLKHSTSHSIAANLSERLCRRGMEFLFKTKMMWLIVLTHILLSSRTCVSTCPLWKWGAQMLIIPRQPVQCSSVHRMLGNMGVLMPNPAHLQVCETFCVPSWSPLAWLSFVRAVRIFLLASSWVSREVAHELCVMFGTYWPAVTSAMSSCCSDRPSLWSLFLQLPHPPSPITTVLVF